MCAVRRAPCARARPARARARARRTRVPAPRARVWSGARAAQTHMRTDDLTKKLLRKQSQIQYRSSAMNNFCELCSAPPCTDCSESLYTLWKMASMQLRHPKFSSRGVSPSRGPPQSSGSFAASREVLGFQALCPLARGVELPLALSRPGRRGTRPAIVRRHFIGSE